MTDAIERRAHTRIRRRLPLVLHGPEGPQPERILAERCLTRDVAAGGLYFVAFRKAHVRLGQTVHFRITVPGQDSAARAGTAPAILFGPHVSGVASVVRVETVEVDGVTGTGVALQFELPLAVAPEWGD